MKRVMDANSLIAFLQGETGASEVAELMADESSELFIHAVNLCEVYYDFYRTNGQQRAEEVVDSLLSLGITIREDMNRSFWQQAGVYKANLRRISLADCFCITLANQLDAQLVTADHHEFDAVAQQGICSIMFIR